MTGSNGRAGTVGVGVKVFSAAQRKSFFEEREVYELARLATSQSMTSSVLSYFGSAENVTINNIVCVSVESLRQGTLTEGKGIVRLTSSLG